jgi:2-polyprenyl-3-methyl-5-hydroxy-6-metoxy-1,4-benzoquinol methylase
MVNKYAAGIDLSNRNLSHTLIVEFAGHDRSVLDIGCARGYVAEALVQRGCRVIGIEIDPEAAKQAEEYCERVIVGNIESLTLDEELGEESFEVIILGDVLEHLKEPLETLRRLKPFLHPEGYIVASLPNIAHGSVRLALMQGKFQYRPLGLLDDTHLRFFTRESVEQLFNEAGYMIGELERTTAGIFQTEVEVDREAVTEEVLEMIQNDPESETYQFVLTAHPSGEAGRFAGLSNRVRLLSEELDRRDRLIYELNRRLRNLEELERRLENRNRRLAEKQREVTELTQRLAKRNHELADSQNTIRKLSNQLEQALRGNR